MLPWFKSCPVAENVNYNTKYVTWYTFHIGIEVSK